jgi:hypothetical protein
MLVFDDRFQAVRMELRYIPDDVLIQLILMMTTGFHETCTEVI